MAVQSSHPPSQATEAVQSTFRHFSENGSFRSPALRAATGTLQLTEPHPMFTLSLGDLAEGKGLEAAKQTGWRYLIQEGDNVLASAEAVATGKGDEHVFSSINEGRFVTSTTEAIRAMRVHPKMNEGSFDLRLLSVPGLYVMALWLHDAKGNSDLLVPLTPSPVDLPAGRPVPAAQLIAELQSKARPIAKIGAQDETGG